MKHSSYRSDLKYLLFALVCAALIGAFASLWALLALVPLLAYCVWQLYQIRKVGVWLEAGADRQQAPSLKGVTDHIVSSICKQKLEQENQQNSLSELLSRFDAATSAMPDALIIIDSNGIIEWCNPASQPLLGIDPGRDIGQPVENIVRDPLVSNYLNAGEFDSPLEFSVKSESGNDGILRVVPYGRNKRLLSVQDHSDVLKLQQVRNSFVSNASHEMRTPLTVIIGYLEALSLRTESDPPILKAVNGALDQARRMQHLIEDLLSLTRLETAPLELAELDRVKIGALTTKVIELAKASTGDQRENLQVSICDDDDVLGNYRELQSAIGNVIENAFKHTPKGAAVLIKLYRDADWLVLSVQDQGEGVDIEHLHRLTERFYRVDKGRSRDKGGTGLGLSIVKHVMNRHGGELLIDSEPGKGSTFTLKFKPA